MPFLPLRAPALGLAVALLLPPPLLAQGRQPAGEGGTAGSVTGTVEPRPAPAERTAKERLGVKWTDEQRVDNCNVPPDKRGTKPRPDTCPGARGIESIEAAPLRPSSR